MKIFKGLDNIPEFEGSVVAIGAFDGVHLGHKRILQFLREESAKINATNIIVTFDPHPKTILSNDDNFFTINTLNENLRLFEQQNIDIVIILPFTEEFSKISYQDFLNDIIINKLHAKALIMGPNHSIGHNREGNHNNLNNNTLTKKLNIIEIPEELHNNAGVHSALIRKHIKLKEWDRVDELLGYNYNHKNEK